MEETPKVHIDNSQLRNMKTQDSMTPPKNIISQLLNARVPKKVKMSDEDFRNRLLK